MLAAVRARSDEHKPGWLMLLCRGAVEVMAEASKEAALPSGSFWDGLLRNQYQQLKALELAAMGKVSFPSSQNSSCHTCAMWVLMASLVVLCWSRLPRSC